MRDIPILSKVLRGLSSYPHDPEKGHPQQQPEQQHSAPPTLPPVTAPPSAYLSSQPTHPDSSRGIFHSHASAPLSSSVHEYVSADDRLAHFRRLVGIDSAPTLTNPSFLQRRAPNVGIYTRTVAAEQKAKKLFKVFSWGINGCLGLQIIVAATLTALGAAGGSRTAVTFFGAVNTIIAGFLTYLKGSGLPNRFKYFQSEWRKVREYIEQREREFGVELYTLNVEEEIRIIEAMYENVRADVEANVPDGYTSVAKQVDGGIGGMGVRAPPLPGMADARRMTGTTIAGVENRFHKEADKGHAGLAKGLDAVFKGIEKLDHKINHTAEKGQQSVEKELERGQGALDAGVARGRETWDHGVERASGVVHDGVERGQQGVNHSMALGLAALHERLDQLDKGLEKVGLQRRHDDQDPKEGPKPGPSAT